MESTRRSIQTAFFQGTTPADFALARPEEAALLVARRVKAQEGDVAVPVLQQVPRGRPAAALVIEGNQVARCRFAPGPSGEIAHRTNPARC